MWAPTKVHEALTHGPESSTERVRNTRETSTRRGIRLEHDERQRVLLRSERGVEQVAHDADAGAVREVVREDVGRVDNRAAVEEVAVVGGVPVR